MRARLKCLIIQTIRHSRLHHALPRHISFTARPEGDEAVRSTGFSNQTTGTTSLTFADPQLRDTLNEEIPADPQAGQIQVVHYPLYDFDRDCDVDVADIMTVATLWNSQAGDGTYDATYDLDGDGDIDVVDIMQVAATWGEVCSGVTARSTQRTALIQEGPEVRFSPPETTVEVGTPFTMGVVISDVVDLGGFEFDLLFDPTAITVTGVYLGDFLAASGNEAVALGPEAVASDHLVFGAFSYGENPAASGAGHLATVELVLLRPAETVLDIVDVQAVNSEGEESLLAPAAAVISPDEQRVYLPLVLRQ